MSRVIAKAMTQSLNDSTLPLGIAGYLKRREERELVQRPVESILAFTDGNVEKFRTHLRRELDKNSKNKAVPRHRLQVKKASEFRGKQIDPVGNIWRLRSSPDRTPDGFNQQATRRDVFASVNSIEHR